MLVELSMVEQRYDAVREVLDGATFTDVATRHGVDRRDPSPLAGPLRHRGRVSGRRGRSSCERRRKAFSPRTSSRWIPCG
jgi:hypothetical protein